MLRHLETLFESSYKADEITEIYERVKELFPERSIDILEILQISREEDKFNKLVEHLGEEYNFHNTTDREIVEKNI